MTHSTRTRLGAALALALLVAACGAASAPSAPATSSPGPAATPPASDPTPVPGGSSDPGGLVPGGVPGGPGDASGGGTGGGGGSQPGNPGDGVVTSPPDAGGGGGLLDPQPTIVKPGTNLTGVHPIGAVKLVPAVNGHDVAVRIEWWSGVEPCSVLAGVGVARDGNTFTLTVSEGSQGEGVACIEIAMYKATIVDLGRLDPGTYTIKAFGEARPVEVTVPA